MDGGRGDVPSKKAKKLCKYLEKWESEFNFLRKSRVGHGRAFCTICNCDFSVAHGGRTDVTQHKKSAKHKRGLEAQKNAPAISPFATWNTPEDDQILNAEVKMAMLCAKNNISFTFCDDFSKCVADMFPDSAIAQKYSAGKTKTTQILKGEAPDLLFSNPRGLARGRRHLTHLPGSGGSSESHSSSELSPEWASPYTHPLDVPPSPAAMEVVALQGVKEEPVMEEPIDVKPELSHSLPTKAIHQRGRQGAETQLLRSSAHAPNDPCEGWRRSPSNSSQTELSEALGSDYTRITFDHESPPPGHLSNCNVGDMVAPDTVPIQEGLSGSSRLSLAERRIVQSNKQLAQEMRAFRQEYAESHRETASILHSIAEALSGVCSNLSEIRDLYLHQQVVTQAMRDPSAEEPE